MRSILADLKVKIKDYNFDIDLQSKPTESLVNNIKSGIALLEKFQTDHDKYFRVADIQNKTIRLHKDKTHFNLSTETFSEIENCRNELSSHDAIYNLFGVEKPRQFADVDNLLNALSFIKDCIENLNSNFGPRLSELSISATFSDFNYKQIQWFIEQYDSLKLPILGYLFRGKQVEELNTKFKKTFKAEELASPQKLTEKLKEIKADC